MPSRIIITYSLALAMCAAILCGSACAADTGTDSSIIVDKFVQAFIVNRDDSYVVTTDNVKTIVQQRAVLRRKYLRTQMKPAAGTARCRTSSRTDLTERSAQLLRKAQASSL